MTNDPFERGRILSEAEDERVRAAKASISDADVERMKDVLMRLPLLDSGRRDLDDAAWKICLAVELARQELAEKKELLTARRAQVRPNARKALAGATTDGAAHWYWILTGRPVTRVSKGVDGTGGLQETGDFAKFLREVFDVFGIKASTAGQVKMWKARVDEYLKSQIHPDEFWRILNSPEELAKLLQKLRSANQSQ